MTCTGKRPARDRFMEKFEQDSNGCWIWTGWLGWGGYGRFKAEGRTRAAHRVAYEYLKGPVPEGLVLDHLCRVRNCVNPEHLEPVTQAENLRRGARAQQTHCIRGHEFDEENTYISPDGRRGCKECRRNEVRRRRARARLAAAPQPPSVEVENAEGTPWEGEAA